MGSVPRLLARSLANSALLAFYYWISEAQVDHICVLVCSSAWSHLVTWVKKKEMTLSFPLPLLLNRPPTASRPSRIPTAWKSFRRIIAIWSPGRTTSRQSSTSQPRKTSQQRLISNDIKVWWRVPSFGENYFNIFLGDLSIKILLKIDSRCPCLNFPVWNFFIRLPPVFSGTSRPVSSWREQSSRCIFRSVHKSICNFHFSIWRLMHEICPINWLAVVSSFDTIFALSIVSSPLTSPFSH